MANTISIIVDGIDKASGIFGSIGDSVANLEGKSTSLLNKGLGPLNSMLGNGLKLAAGGAAAGLIALAGGIYSGTQTAADFQQQIQDMSASMQTSEEETAQLKDLILDLGLDPKLKVDAKQAAAAITGLGTAGLDTTEILNGAARSTVLLSNATGADYSKSANVATDIMSLFNIEAEGLQKAVNGIVGVTLESKLTFDDYVLALGNGAKGAKAANLGFDQFNQILTATASNFTSGMTQGTALTAMLSNLAPGTKKAESLMKELGIITAEGKNRFFDLNGEVVNNVELSNVLRDTLGKLTTEQRLQAVDTLFGRDALAAVNGMMGTTTESWTKYATALASTDAEKQAAARMDSYRGVMEILGGTIETLKIKIGDKFLPIFERLAEKFSSFLSDHADQLVAWAESLANNLEALIGWIMAVVEDGDLMNDWLTRMNPTLAEIVLNVANFVKWLTDVIPPIVSFINETIGLEGVLVALGAILASTVILNIIAMVGTVISAVSGFMSLFGAISSLAPILGTLSILINPVTLAIAAVVAVVGALYLAWSNNWLGIQDVTYNVIDRVKSLFSDLITSTDLSGLRDRVVNQLDSYRDSFATGASSLVSSLKSGIQRVATDPVGAINSVLDSIIAVLADNAKGGGLKATLSNLGVTGVTKFKDGINQVAKDPAGAMTNVVNSVASAVNTAITIGSTIANQLNAKGSEVAGYLWAGVKGAASGGADAIAAGIASVSNWVKTNLGETSQLATDLWVGANAASKQLIDGLIWGVSSLSGKVTDKVSEVAKGMIEAVKNVFQSNSPAKAFRNLSHFAMQGLELGVNDMFNVPAEAMAGAADQMVGSAQAAITNTSNRINNFNVSLQGQGRSDRPDSTVYSLVNTLSAVYG